MSSTSSPTHTPPTAVGPLAHPTRAAVARAGGWCLAAGVVGVAQALGVLAWPHQVAETRFSFPFTAAGHVIAQATFLLQHLPLLAALAVLAGTAAVRASRVARSSLLVATLGMALLAVMEVVCMVAATTDVDSTLGTIIATLYGPPTILVGGGLTVAGIALLRRHSLDALLGWTLTALGGYVFLGLLPTLASGSFVAARLGIMGWMALFAVLGWGMVRARRV